MKNKKIKTNKCLCGSGKTSENCCLRLINASQMAETAEQLMRSRYTAYVLCDASYLLSSWHSSTRPDELNLNDGMKWRGLQVVNFTANEPASAVVEFVAEFEHDGAIGQMHERSRFLQEKGRWYYLDGQQLTSGEYVIEPPGRNEPCCCGSGIKYKKCCGV